MTYDSRHGRTVTPSRDRLRSPFIFTADVKGDRTGHPAGDRLTEFNTPEVYIPDNPGDADTLLHLLIGPLYAVNLCCHELHLRGYAEPNDWSHPMKMLNTAEVMRSQHPNDVMRVLRKRVRPTQ